jgi:hypothetical protein
VLSLQKSIRLFSFAGIEVFLHWSWFLIAVYEIQGGLGRRYSSVAWNIAEYLSLFLIVLMHEFGHALACRQVGGIANRIVLWPMGGVAYVDPPPRPGATLWSIAAGPLVNVVLFPILWIVVRGSRVAGLPASQHDLFLLLQAMFYINFRTTRFQSPSYLPARRRSNSAISLLVCSRASSQPGDRDSSGPCWRVGIRSSRIRSRILVVRGPGSFCPDELLGRVSARALPAQDRKAPSASGLRVSYL